MQKLSRLSFVFSQCGSYCSIGSLTQAFKQRLFLSACFAISTARIFDAGKADGLSGEEVGEGAGSPEQNAVESIEDGSEKDAEEGGQSVEEESEQSAQSVEEQSAEEEGGESGDDQDDDAKAQSAEEEGGESGDDQDGDAKATRDDDEGSEQSLAGDSNREQEQETDCESSEDERMPDSQNPSGSWWAQAYQEFAEQEQARATVVPLQVAYEWMLDGRPSDSAYAGTFTSEDLTPLA